MTGKNKAFEMDEVNLEMVVGGKEDIGGFIEVEPFSHWEIIPTVVEKKRIQYQ